MSSSQLTKTKDNCGFYMLREPKTKVEERKSLGLMYV